MKKRLGSILLLGALVLGLAGAPAQAVSRTFTDIAAGAWYYEVVTAMADSGLIKGYGDGSFRPSATVTAAEYVTIVARAAGLGQAESQVDHWAAGHMQAALAAGWYDWDEIPPETARFDQPLSRQVAIKVLMKALHPQATGLYSDWAGRITDFSDLDGRYYEPVFAAYQSGIVQGDDSGRLLPREGVSRAQVCAMVQRAMKGATVGPPATGQTEPPEPPKAVTTLSGGASEHGWLQVVGTQLCSESGQPVVLRGMSTHGMQWYGNYATSGAMGDLAGRGANLFRVAMYTGEGGYIGNEDAIRDKVFAAVDRAIEQDLYVILDWHILSDGNPNTYKTQALAFFSEAAQRYSDCPNVIYEICNEPNGDVTWARDIKPYAQAVIPVIREKSPKAVVIVGTGTWSQDVDAVAASPLDTGNVMYALHFYAGTHGQWLRDRVDKALSAGTPIFVSEWGLSDATGGGSIYPEEGKRWADFMQARGLSWANWSLCDKQEASAALMPGASPDGGWADSDLSPSGKWVFALFSK